MPFRVGVTFGNAAKLAPYEDALRRAGLEPVPISAERPRTLEGLDGLLLSGGTDIDPALYGQQPHAQTGSPDRPRDALEIRLLREALDAGLPVLAICRGMQLFNVVHHGTLNQHLANADEHRVTSDPAGDVHAVTVVGRTRLASILEEGHCTVNSRHHQAVDVVGQGLIVTARSADGVVEALERPDLPFAIAVEWHPEDRCRLPDAVDHKLFDAFAAAVAGVKAAGVKTAV